MTSIRIAAGDVPDPGGRMLKFVDGRSVVLLNVEGVIHAIDNSCPHNGASLANGRLDGHILQCPAHGLRFDLVSGCVVGAPGMCLTKLTVESEPASRREEQDLERRKEALATAGGSCDAGRSDTGTEQI